MPPTDGTPKQETHSHASGLLTAVLALLLIALTSA